MITERDYNEAMELIDLFLAKGSAKMTEADLAELQRLSLLTEQYEDVHYPMPISTKNSEFALNSV